METTNKYDTSCALHPSYKPEWDHSIIKWLKIKGFSNPNRCFRVPVYDAKKLFQENN